MIGSVEVRTQPYGDSAVLITTHHGEPGQRWRTVHALAAALDTDPPVVPICDAVAAFDTLVIQIEPAPGAHDVVTAWVHTTHRRLVHPNATAVRTFHIPTVFGGRHGPDLDDVASELGMAPADLVEAVTTARWVVRLMGAPVGAPMLDGAVFPTSVRRCREPRTHVPAGSVALAGQQAVVYPVTTPGGWRLIGRTPLVFLDLQHDPPTEHRPGDVFRFDPIPADDWDRHAGRRLGVRDD